MFHIESVLPEFVHYLAYYEYTGSTCSSGLSPESTAIRY
jgi:hypothetical protein